MNKTKMIVVTIFCYGLVSMLPGWVFSLPTQAHQLWYVTETGDDSSDCLTTNTPCASIMEALTKPAFAPGDTILVAEGSYTNYKDFAAVHITQTVTISGGWDETFTYQDGLSGLTGYRAFNITSGAVVTITHFNALGFSIEGLFNEGTVTVSDSRFSSVDATGFVNLGKGTVDHSLFINSPDGGIGNGGTLTVTDSLITDNVYNGIYNLGDLTLIRTTVSRHLAGHGCAGIAHVGDGFLLVIDSAITGNVSRYSGVGGGLCNYGLAILVNSTISGNRVDFPGPPDYWGGGVVNIEGHLELYNVTISGNSAPLGGGIYNYEGYVLLQNSLIANNYNYDLTLSDDCYGVVESVGYNLIGDTTNCTVQTSYQDLLNVPGFVFPTVGEGYAGLPRDIYPPPYAPLLSFSPAIDAGNPNGCLDHAGNLLTTDQRGIPRLGPCDIGAYEYDPVYDPLLYQWFPFATSP